MDELWEALGELVAAHVETAHSPELALLTRHRFEKVLEDLLARALGAQKPEDVAFVVTYLVSQCGDAAELREAMRHVEVLRPELALLRDELAKGCGLEQEYAIDHVYAVLQDTALIPPKQLASFRRDYLSWKSSGPWTVRRR